MPYDDHDSMTGLATLLQAGSDQFRADAFALMIGNNGHWSEGERIDRTSIGNDVDVAEQDVADHLTVEFSHERWPHEATVPLLTFNPNGTFVYVPEADFIGTDRRREQAGVARVAGGW